MNVINIVLKYVEEISNGKGIVATLRKIISIYILIILKVYYIDIYIYIYKQTVLISSRDIVLKYTSLYCTTDIQIYKDTLVQQ